MEKFKTIALVVLSLALVIVSCLLVHQILITTNEPVAPIIKTDSVVHTETVYVEVPVEKIKYKEITKVESVFVEVPVTQEKIPFEEKHYEDSIADIYISGYKPNIDSIEYHIPRQTIYVDRTIEIEKPKSFWQDRFIFSVGVYAGYSPIYNNFDVTFGIGVGVRLGR